MGNFFLPFILLLALASCNGQSSTESSTLKSSNNTLQKQEACEVLSLEEVGKLLKTEIVNLVSEDMSFGSNKRRSICHVIVKGKIAAYNIRLAWKSEKAQEKKTLERDYNRYLTQGEKEMSNYEELKNENGSQILYGVQQNKLGVNHLIRKRFGNSAEAKIEIFDEQENKELKEQLLKIIEDIH